MSRYLILIIFNVPAIVAGIVNSITSYKLKRTSRRRFGFRLLLWVGILLGIVFAEPLYSFLFSNNLTKTEPLSLFDVVQITGIVMTYYLANQAYIKSENLERRVQMLHQQLSIRISEDESEKN